MRRSFANVGLFCDCFPPVMDGVAVCMENYARWMQEKVGRVKVITPNVPEADYGALPYEVLNYLSVPIPMRKPYVAGFSDIDPLLFKKLAETRFRIVHAHCPFTSGRAAQRVAKRQGIPCVGTFHSKYREDFSRLFIKPVVDVIIKNIIAFYENCDLVWVPQESVIDVIREYGYTGPVEVMDNGSDLVADYPEQFFVEARRKLGIKPETFVMLFVGQHIWEKNPKLIIEGLAEMGDVPFRMFFIGTGYAEEEMKALVSEKGLDDKVTFVGLLKDRQYLTQYYAAADLFLFPSLYDNAPLVVREAAALHTPAVMAEGATASSIIRDGENGFLVRDDPQEFAAKVRSLVADPARVHRVGVQAAHSIVRSWEDCVEEALDRYNVLLKSWRLPEIERL